MTPDDFRRIALGEPGTAEGAHMNHADFRLDGRIFATLGSPGSGFGMVKIDPEQQEMLIAAEPLMFSPAKGAWGLAGATLVRLDAADAPTVTSAIRMALTRARADNAKGRRKRPPAP
jgi:hypothetical protein